MSTLIGIEPEALSNLISAAVSKALQAQEEKANLHRLVTAKEVKKILSISHTWLDALGKEGLLTPQVGGGKGSTRLYKFTDVQLYMNRNKRN